jgi:outer membrane immunogenic protein
MKSFLLAGVTAFGLVAFAAGAADAAGWNGVYVAGGVGYGAWSADTTTVDPVTHVCALCTSTRQGGNGGLGTIAIGFDHQFNNIVAGAFIDGDLASIQGDVQDQGPFFVGHETETSAISEGVRVGWLVNPTTLPYLAVGASQAHFKGGALVDNSSGGAATGNSVSAANRGGFFVGAGVETKINAHWSWKLEYRYADYGKATLTDTGTVAGQDDITFKPIVQTGRVEVAFRF